MKIVDALRGPEPAFSFEFFPPKDAEGVERLFETAAELRRYKPTYVSVTYGAGGSTQQLTVELVRRIKAELNLEAMAHLTCVGASQAELREVLQQLREARIENVLALRGDPPKGETAFVPHPDGFANASELAGFAAAGFDFCLAGACYPEKHPEAPSLEEDLLQLKKKVDAGVQFLISQLFFDNRDYFAFVDKARALGIQVPIVAGIMPITNVAQVKRFTQMCGATIPPALLARLEIATDPAEVRAIGVEHATAQCRELLAGGAPGIHFYTLNRSLATREILDNLRQAGLAR
ncbi:MAG TPA: methylenetetrahydrofolate reductase [NAD(P)H] [Polyangiaceae bacterium]|nr:methylenetetrahydrofolate reductase [NAD(P)H] [Polyangiaceae bacterium]